MEIMPLHIHNNPVTGAAARSATWPCPQCVALGRTGPLEYGRDVPEGGGVTRTEIPPERLEAYLATFPAPSAPDAVLPGGHRARRKARRKAERQGRRGRR